mmetsp:Transcript_17750/g.55598  ORF Transcript_17750/g.55598 Transcript_17750/m.55598 type:complete len:429 (-) Transcript_17750:1134-2420(-)
MCREEGAVLAAHEGGELDGEAAAVVGEAAAGGDAPDAGVLLLEGLAVEGEPDLAGRDVNVPEEEGDLRREVARALAHDDLLADVDDLDVGQVSAVLVVVDRLVALLVLGDPLEEVAERLLGVPVSVVRVLQLHPVVPLEDGLVVADRLDEDQRHPRRRRAAPSREHLAPRPRRVRRVEDGDARRRLRPEPGVHLLLARHRQLLALPPRRLVPRPEERRRGAAQAPLPPGVAHVEDSRREAAPLQVPHQHLHDVALPSSRQPNHGDHHLVVGPHRAGLAVLRGPREVLVPVQRARRVGPVLQQLRQLVVRPTHRLLTRRQPTRPRRLHRRVPRRRPPASRHRLLLAFFLLLLSPDQPSPHAALQPRRPRCAHQCPARRAHGAVQHRHLGVRRRQPHPPHRHPLSPRLHRPHYLTTSRRRQARTRLSSFW